LESPLALPDDAQPPIARVATTPATRDILSLEEAAGRRIEYHHMA
jgi:hypothetical protein